ncbi:MAG: PKD domain-containing protein [Flavobacteriales bacterium]|jgi:hypothetical protein|nr:PKD domain-containing protein [Flavobacteriales bacterium]
MRTAFRTLTFLLGTSAMALVAHAQPLYTLIVEGTIAGCTNLQQVNIASTPGSIPSYNYTLEVAPNACFYDTILHFNSPAAGVVVTTMCGGLALTATDTVTFNGVIDTATVVLNFNCGGLPMDCLGVPGGSALPGTACTTFLGVPGTWDNNCDCVANAQNCQACFTITSAAPWSADFTNCSTGNAPFTYEWWLPDGSSATTADAAWTFNSEGVYGVCLTIADANGCSSWVCDSILVDANGGISTGPIVWDCLGVANGPATPGTACTLQGSLPGIWSANCWCLLDTAMSDCEGVQGGPALPGTPCETEWNGQVLPGLWTNQCWCDTLAVGVDCLGIVNGPNVPGAPCQNPATGVNGYWDANCICVPDTNTTGCQAGFWVFQAYEIDSLNPNGGATPIPYELWIWNLSTGLSPFQFEWDFGDGASSFDPYPTHTYGASGPYNLCLTISDASGCTSIYCDSISIDGDGLYWGLAPQDGEVRNGFTINVLNQLPTAVEERSFNEPRLWPNPVTDALSISFRSTVSGNVPLSIIDLNGRVLLQDNLAYARGANRIDLSAAQLAPGLYVLRIGNDANAMNIRFVKN